MYLCLGGPHKLSSSSTILILTELSIFLGLWGLFLGGRTDLKLPHSVVRLKSSLLSRAPDKERSAGSSKIVMLGLREFLSSLLRNGEYVGGGEIRKDIAMSNYFLIFCQNH